MRKSYALIFLGVCLLAPGCAFARNIPRNLIHEVRHTHAERVLYKRAHRLALQAYEAMVQRYGECFSEDYQDGFVDGFVDFLVYGGCVSGCGEAPAVPAVPPPRYTAARYMSPEGYRAIEEWYMGFRHGSATALASGLRNLVVVPVFNAPDLDPESRYRMGPSGGPPPADDPTTLQMPRPVDTGGASLIPSGSSPPVNPGVPIPGGAPGFVPGAPNPGGPPGAPPIGPAPGGRPAAPPPGGVPGVPRP